MMGGDITVESVVSRGSRFSIKLPRASDAQSDEPEADVSDVSLAGPFRMNPRDGGASGRPRSHPAPSPAASPASPSGLSGAAPEAPALPATVLVVEDNEDNLFTLCQILARRRLEIVTATNGRQAIERCCW